MTPEPHPRYPQPVIPDGETMARGAWLYQRPRPVATPPHIITLDSRESPWRCEACGDIAGEWAWLARTPCKASWWTRTRTALLVLARDIRRSWHR